MLEGRDFGRITQTAAKIQTMTLGGVSFGLSREQRAKVETEAQTIAIERFKAKAAELAKGFGFSGYSLREVSVNANDQGFPRPVRMAMEAEGIEKIPILPEGRPTTTPTTPRILENFADVAWSEFQEGERTVTFPVELNDTQKLLLKLAEVPQTLYR